MRFPPESSAGSRVVAADYDGDGAIDLFVGGRVVPWRYGGDPQSLLLHNDGRGHFTNVTAQAAPALEHVGMVTDASWRDVDGDGRLDLVVVGEWMPITVFHNEGGGAARAARGPRCSRSSEGWWNRIVAGDFTGDGRVDFVVGNLGENGRAARQSHEPVTMVVKDFDGNDAFEQILACRRQGGDRALPLRDDLLRALPMLAPRFPTYASYAGKTVEQIFTSAELRRRTVEASEDVRDDARAQRRRRPVHARAAAGRGAARAHLRHPPDRRRRRRARRSAARRQLRRLLARDRPHGGELRLRSAATARATSRPCALSRAGSSSVASRATSPASAVRRVTATSWPGTTTGRCCSVPRCRLAESPRARLAEHQLS